MSALLEVATMRRLLSANLRRLWINKAFWVTAIFMSCVEVFLCSLLLKQGHKPMELQGPIAMDIILFLSFQGIGILTSVFFSLFLGTEYSDGTIRNKLIVGHKRSSIYFASFITGIIAVTIIYLAGVLTGSVIGILSFAPPTHSIGQIALAGLIGWLACVSYIAIFNLIGMLSSSKARTSILCIMTAFTLAFAGMILFALLQGTPSATLLFLYEFSPVGQAAQTMPIDIDAPWRLATYALILSTILTAMGLYIFSKKDLK